MSSFLLISADATEISAIHTRHRSGRPGTRNPKTPVMRSIQVLAIAALALTVPATLMPAEQLSPSQSRLLVGTWELVRAEVEAPDGAISIDPNYGSAAKGLLVIDREGRYSLQVFRPDRTKFASGDKARGTPEEYKAALLGMSTHFGHITIDETNHKLVFHIELAAFPNWEHTEQARTFQLAGNELSYRIPPRPGGTIAISVWHRVEGP
jgi:hypothetical protein